MKKRLFSLALILLLTLSLCGCSASFDSVKDNLESKGYTVNVYNEELIGDMQDNLIYVYGGDGKILNALSATKEGQKVVVIEFENKSDLDIMYRELQKGLAETDKMDLSSNILAYGTPEAVKTALK